MAAALGIGTRVSVGWVPDHKMHGHDVRLRVGTITNGPYLPGETLFFPGLTLKVTTRSWAVTVDNMPGESFADEAVLVPIDDDGQVAEVEQTLEVVA